LRLFIDMGSNSSVLLQREELEEISNETGFNSKQIKRLYNRFKSLDKHNMGYLNRQDFLRIPELHVNPMCDRIIGI
jgi:calcineurin B family protein 1